MKRYWMIAFPWQETTKRNFQTPSQTVKFQRLTRQTYQFVTVSSDTLSLIKDGIRYGKISDGSFDITIGTLSDLWNFSEIAETAKSDENEVDASVVPSPEQIEAALAHVNYKNIEIKGNQVRLKDPHTKIDLGGIAKGFIADEMRSFLNKKESPPA